jgi:hypothetical protein
VPPSGWTNTHPSNWVLGYSSYAGGSYPEARFNWYPSQTADFRLYSYAVDTSDYGAVEISFKHYVNHFGGPYQLKFETSPDGTSWTTVWSMDGASAGPETITVTTGDNIGSTTTYFSWTFSGNSYNINYWYVDDLVVNGYPLAAPEYEDEICISDIDVGEELELEFDDWTPAFLAEGLTGTRTYKASIWTDMQTPPDKNGANDEFGQFVKLDFFHDVGIREVSSPYDNPEDMIYYAVDSGAGQFNWFDPADPGTFNYISNFPSSNFPQGATFDKDQKNVGL